MQLCTLLQTDNHASTLLLSFRFFYKLDALPATNQQHQSTEGKSSQITSLKSKLKLENCDKELENILFS